MADSYKYKVDTGALGDAISTIASCKSAIDTGLGTVKSQCTSIEASWQGPAGSSFAALHKPLTDAAGDLSDLLGDIIKRMKLTLETYHDTEAANAQDLTSRAIDRTAPLAQSDSASRQTRAAKRPASRTEMQKAMQAAGQPEPERAVGLLESGS
jgi:WXG100 family type VII secretion target